MGTNTVKLDIEEYLIGLTHLSNELSRLAVNCVTSEDYSRPERIADFITSLNSGFRLLDLKKVEEVVYDLSIRGLNKTVEAENKTVKKEGEAENIADTREVAE